AIRDCVGAISVGIVHGQAVLDLNYVEDSSAEVDMNVVMTGAGEFVEVQGTAEQVPFGRARLDALLAIAEGGIRRLVAPQRRARALHGTLRRAGTRRPETLGASARAAPRRAPGAPDRALPLRDRAGGPGARREGSGRCGRRPDRGGPAGEWRFRIRSAVLLSAA